MGSSNSSETNITSSTSIVLDAIQSTVQETSINAYTNANLTISIVGNRNIVHDISQTVSTVVDWKQMLSAGNQADFMNKLTQKISALTQQHQGSLSGFLNSNQSLTNINISQAVNQSVKQLSKQAQNLKVDTTGTMVISIVGNDNQVFNISQTSMGKFGIQLANTITNKLKSSNTLSTSASSKTSQTFTGLIEDIGNLLKGLLGPIILVVIVVVIGGAFIMLSPAGQHAVTKASDTAADKESGKSGKIGNVGGNSLSKECVFTCFNWRSSLLITGTYIRFTPHISIY